MNAVGIDHLVLTVENVDRTCEFYSSVLGADVHTFEGDRTALHFGDQKVNLHPVGDEYRPHATRPVPGSRDFCLRIDRPLSRVRSHLDESGVSIVHGPVDKIGARGGMRSLYVRDPDGNLVEIARYDDGVTPNPYEEG